MTYDENRISDQIDGGLKSKEEQQLIDHFAGLAMQGFISKYGNDGSYNVLAEMSYQVAEAMLKSRKDSNYE